MMIALIPQVLLFPTLILQRWGLSIANVTPPLMGCRQRPNFLVNIYTINVLVKSFDLRSKRQGQWQNFDEYLLTWQNHLMYTALL